jgi:hypothetical protein
VWGTVGIVGLIVGLLCYAVALFFIGTIIGAIVVEAGHGSMLVAIFCVQMAIFIPLRHRAE